MEQWKKDLISGILLAALTAGVIVYTYWIPPGTVEYAAARPGAYLRGWLFALLALCVALIIRAWRARSGTQKAAAAFDFASCFTIASLALYVFSLDYLGFRLASTIFMTIGMTVYSRKAKVFQKKDGTLRPRLFVLKRIVLYALISTAVAFGTHYVFSEAVGVLMPEFSLFEF